jgi:hypothetical protein
MHSRAFLIYFLFALVCLIWLIQILFQRLIRPRGLRFPLRLRVIQSQWRRVLAQQFFFGLPGRAQQQVSGLGVRAAERESGIRRFPPFGRPAFCAPCSRLMDSLIYNSVSRAARVHARCAVSLPAFGFGRGQGKYICIGYLKK